MNWISVKDRLPEEKMREIKFRAWDKKEKIMIYSDKEYKEGYYFVFEGDAEELDDNIMQYTGLKDANGKEIYEGDIISIGDGIAQDSLFVVEYKIGCYGELVDWYVQDRELINIIGNIYENPELL